MGGKRRLVAVALAVMVGAAACGGGGGKNKAAPTPTTPQAEVARPGAFFGAVAFTTDRIALAFDAPDGAGTQRVRALVTDGEPDGDAEWFEGRASKGGLQLTSASGRARLEGSVHAAETTGTVTLADGKTRTFHTIPATHGAGIYDVEVTADGHYTGTSTEGSKLDGHQVGEFVEGSLTTPNGDNIPYRVADLSRAMAYSTKGGAPDRYTVVVSRYGLTQVGRGGGDDLKAGRPGANLLALDLGASTSPTPGTYYGKVSMVTDQLVIVVDKPDAPEGSRIRAYLSDGEPPPGGNIEWFVGTLRGGRFDLTSASKKARLTGAVGSDSVSATVTLPNDQPRRVFAVPAGDGAGIYEVKVDASGLYTGTSESGGRLELHQDGHSVHGTITMPQGRAVSVLGYDLTQVFGYQVRGSQPDTYLAFASPSGRYIIGRSGDVRGGTSGTNIIGLDKAC